MFFIIGFLVVVGSVIGGYVGGDGHLSVLWMPFEFLIIFGAGLGSVLIGNPKTVLVGVIKSMGALLRGSKYNKASYLELLGVLYALFRLAKTKGDLALENHVERPDESPLFQAFPRFSREHHALVFLCDYLRLLTLGTSNSHEMEAVMDEELETHHNEMRAISNAIGVLGDALPALGIVAAVLGIVITMQAINGPPEEIGHKVAVALVGTFLGIFLSYGFIQPLATNLDLAAEEESKVYDAIKSGIISLAKGFNPIVSVEFARRSIPNDYRPTFQEMESFVKGVK